MSRAELFCQAPPRLGNQYDDDRLLRALIRHHFPRSETEVEEELRMLGELAGGELYEQQLEELHQEPELVRWDPWGNRVDRVRLTPLWQRAERLAAEHGLVATAYEGRHGTASRVLQFAKVYLFHASTDVYTCPLAMTDGAARTLLASGNTELIERAVPRLTSRDPARFWTSGQWMTESTGGSDVGRSETRAVIQGDGSWRLYGRKWFTSAVASDMALALARPEGNAPGASGLALFYVETRDADGCPNGMRATRLKDKLGTRKLPTAELLLEGARARLVGAPAHGVRDIVPMLVITRAWNSICAIATMRRGIALALDYARRRLAFGRPLSDQPLHLDTLAGLQAELDAAFHLTFRLVTLIGLSEAGEPGPAEAAELRLLSSLTKLVTGRQVVAVTSEVLESFGGAGYVEDTGLPLLLRDGQVLPIWEGTTNVLALDFLRALEEVGGMHALRERVGTALASCSKTRLRRAAERARDDMDRAAAWYDACREQGDETVLQAGARRFALRVGRALATALACEHAQWACDNEGDRRPTEAVRYLARAGRAGAHRLKAEPTRRLALDLAADGEEA
jgi:alkylation response protein AidB-like acyl-CoA dehydrogenase